jgi:transcriptional regulator with XRE-family HTH domain
MDSPKLVSVQRGSIPAERVVLLRHRRKWKQEDLAREAGLKVDTIRRIERGSDVRIHSLELVAQALGVTVSYLYKPID